MLQNCLRIAPVIGLVVAGVPSRAGAAAAMTGPSAVIHMDRSLARVGSVGAEGVLHGPGTLTTRYRFVFVAPGREQLVRSGGALPNVHVAGKSLTQESEVSIGKTLYHSVDGQHWTRAARSTAATALDSLTLNGLGLACCTAPDLAPGHFATIRAVTGHGRNRIADVQVRAVTASGIITTRVRISLSTWLPLSYTSWTQPSLGWSQVELRYHINASIRTPASS